MSQEQITLKKSYTIPFVQVPREIINHKSLSWKAKGLMAYLLDKPDSWKFSIKGIAAQGKEGVNSVRSALVELKENGYLRVTKVVDCKSKRFKGTVWEITPFSNNFSEVRFSDLGFSDLGKSTTSNNIYKKDSPKEESKKKIRKEDATSADAYALCSYLLEKIKEKKPNFSGGISASWQKEAEKLLKIRSLHELKGVIDFMVTDEFMREWTFSMAKIRKHLDTAEVKMARGSNIPPAPPAKETQEFKKNQQIAQYLEKKYNGCKPDLYISASDDCIFINDEPVAYKDENFGGIISTMFKMKGIKLDE